MARPEKYNVDYFPLYIDDGRKMFYIEQKYQNDGHSTWIKILKELAKADHHFLNLNDNTQMMYLSSQCFIDEITLKNIITDLVKLGEFDNELWTENKVLFSEKFVLSVSDAYSKRINKPPRKQDIINLLIGLGVRKPRKGKKSTSDKPQSKVKDSKVEESIYPDWLDIKLWNEYKKHREEIKSKMTDRAEKLAINAVKKLIDKGHSQDEVINQSIMNGWKGIFEPKNTIKNTEDINDSLFNKPITQEEMDNLPI